MDYKDLISQALEDRRYAYAPRTSGLVLPCCVLTAGCSKAAMTQRGRFRCVLNYATPATDRCKMFIFKPLSCSIVSKNHATTLLQLCYRRGSYFAYARKVFCIGS